MVGLSLPGMPACRTRRYGVTSRDVLLSQRGLVTSDGEGRVRIAELVAALPLGVDLGFGQPMEHVLRQCLIALNLAERAGLDEESRAAVYYTALLVNVGCHTDAHEQAKWFGDDIAMKSRKYDYDMRSMRASASAMRFLGSGHPPLHRFRLGIEFAVSGHRELDGMIDRHAKMTRLLAEQLGLADAVLDGVGDGLRAMGRKGLAGRRGRRGHSGACTDRSARRIRRGGAPPRRGRSGGRIGPRAQREAVRPDAGRATPERKRGTSWPAPTRFRPGMR